MGLYDRDYTQSDYESGHGYRPQMRMVFPSMTPVVKWLLIINISVFVLTAAFRPLGDFALDWLSVYPLTLAMSLQVWRLITYQFVHDMNGFGHIFINMLVLYFFGIMLERTWGSKKFLGFYLMCGAMGGILYPILAGIGWLTTGPLIGASGAILGIIAACAVLAPNMRVYVFGIFPMKLAVLALIVAAIAVFTLVLPDKFGNAGGEAAHLAGMAAGALYVFSQSWRTRFRFKIKHRFGEKKKVSQFNLQADLDNILDKVHREGIHSLTRREKRVLKQATELERRRKKL
jgi:membrane associated rhomboid family serine protease